MKFWNVTTTAVRLLLAVLLPCLLSARGADAQFEADALYELGASSTDLGTDEGQSTFGYGFGLSGTYALRRKGSMGLLAGADFLVRGFGLDVPGRLTEDVGVFRQADLLLDQFVALRLRAVAAGLYLEQRRIERGTQAGAMGFPISAAGFLVRFAAGPRERLQWQLSYASVLSGRVRLEGMNEEPELESGRSLRASARYRISGGISVRGEYFDTELILEPGTSLRSFFDHRQRGFHLGLVVMLWPSR